jgi:hypothetical protein
VAEELSMSEQLFSHIDKRPEDYFLKYPERSLPDGAEVTRFAPSPTGYLHIGGLFASLIAERVAHQSGGVFFLRIEDTDKKREIEDGVTESSKASGSSALPLTKALTARTTKRAITARICRAEGARSISALPKALLNGALHIHAFAAKKNCSRYAAYRSRRSFCPAITASSRMPVSVSVQSGGQACGRHALCAEAEVAGPAG